MSPAAQQHSREEILAWLGSRAEALNIRAALFPGGARMENDWLQLPVRIEGAANAYERAAKLQELEDAWNNQEPRPEPQIFLMPAGNRPPR